MRPGLRIVWGIVILVCGLAAAMAQEPPARAAAEEIEGRWEIRLNGMPLVIVEFAAKDGRWTGKVLASIMPPGMAPSLDDVRVDGDGLRFVLGPGGVFQGKREGDRLAGTAELGGNPVPWVGGRTTSDTMEAPTEPEDVEALNAALRIRNPNERREALQTFLRDFPESTRRDIASYELAETIRDSEERLAAFQRFATEFPSSAMASRARLQILVDAATRRPVDDSRLKETIDSYLASVPETPLTLGSRVIDRRAEAYHTVADILMQNDLLLDQALELIDQAIASVREQTSASTHATYLATRGQILYERKDYDGALAALQKGLEVAGSAAGSGAAGSETHFLLGKVLEEKGDREGALRAYLDASASGGGKEIKHALERLYREEHGSLEGLHEKLDEALLSRPKPFEAGRHEHEAGQTSGRVVLAELFTGSECRPCIAADLAFEGLVERYDRGTVAVLQYHLHIPGPDPMTNHDTERRAKYYGVSGTPTMIIDGHDKQMGGGYADRSPSLFNVYKQKIESRLPTPPGLKLADLSLEREGDRVRARGRVELRGLEADVAAKSRLRLALVEEIIHYTGGNGIHFHHYVVRKMLGPEEGLPLEQASAGALEFDESASLSSLRDSLEEYLESYAKKRSEERGAFEWAEKLHEVGRERIAAVAFVQNDDSKEILQTAVIH